MKFHELSDDEWVDSTTVEARKGGLIGYDGNKHRKGCKVHAAVTAESLPLSIAVGPGDEHDSKRFIEVLGRIRVKRNKVFAMSSYLKA
ncbi:MAG: transposase [Thaumarchaeota archaeon]|nr:transposase [Nitrososphaerota archaeon]